MPDQKPADGSKAAAGLRASSVMMFAALLDLVVIVPYSYWRLSGHKLAMIIALAIEGVGVLSLLGVAIRLRRLGT